MSNLLGTTQCCEILNTADILVTLGTFFFIVGPTFCVTILYKFSGTADRSLLSGRLDSREWMLYRDSIKSITQRSRQLCDNCLLLMNCDDNNTTLNKLTELLQLTSPTGGTIRLRTEAKEFLCFLFLFVSAITIFEILGLGLRQGIVTTTRLFENKKILTKESFSEN
jgi:hypothetical protein